MRYLMPTLIILLLASLIANGVMYAKYRSHRPIMTVNGVGISKFDMDSYLEQTQGPQYKALMAQRHRLPRFTIAGVIRHTLLSQRQRFPVTARSEQALFIEKFRELMKPFR